MNSTDYPDDEDRQWEEACQDYLDELESLGWDWDAYDPD